MDALCRVPQKLSILSMKQKAVDREIKTAFPLLLSLKSILVNNLFHFPQLSQVYLIMDLSLPSNLLYKV